MEEILGGVTKDLSIWQQMAQTSSIDLFCGVWLDGSSEEFHISPATLTKLGERGIRLSLDIYADIETNEDSEAT